jgi:hypothetical protein
MHMVKHFLMKKSFRTVPLKNLWSQYLTVPEFEDITCICRKEHEIGFICWLFSCVTV